MSTKEKTTGKGIFGVRKSACSQFRPFGRHAEAYPSDDSDDSDYEPSTEGPDHDDSSPIKHVKQATIPSVVASKGDGGSVKNIKRPKSAVDGLKIGFKTAGTVDKACSTKAWSDILPSEILLSIFVCCVQSQGPIPLLSRLAS